MGFDIEELRKQFPLCEFTKEYQYLGKVLGVNFKLHKLYFTICGFVLEDFKHVYDTIDYVMSFLKANNFKTANGFIILSNHITISVDQGYSIEIDKHVQFVNADELIEIVKKELNIETVYKQVLEY